MAEVRAAAPEDLELVTSIAAAAFQDDPVMSWVFQDPATRPDRLRGLFSLPGRDMLGGNGTVHVCDGTAVSLWRDPAYDHGRPRGGDESAVEKVMVAFEMAEIERMMAMGATMTASHPHEPHWYLNILGTRPAHQGAGLGARVLAPVLARCDADGVRAYLESTNPRNHSFYHRLGFVDAGELEIPGGPSLMAMWRDPR